MHTGCKPVLRVSLRPSLGIGVPVYSGRGTRLIAVDFVGGTEELHLSLTKPRCRAEARRYNAGAPGRLQRLKALISYGLCDVAAEAATP